LILTNDLNRSLNGEQSIQFFAAVKGITGVSLREYERGGCLQCNK